jgi:hypothetical protein
MGEHHGIPRRIRAVASHITKETWPSPALPITRIVSIDARSRMQHAQERMLRGIDHDSSVPGPHRQIARLRIDDTPKFRNPRIECHRRSIVIGESRFLIQAVYKVRAIVPRSHWRTGIHCHMCDREALASRQQPNVRSLPTNLAATDLRRDVRSCSLLLPSRRRNHQAT